MPREHGRTVTEPQDIGDGAVISRSIAADTIVAADIAAYGVGSGEVASGAIVRGTVASGVLLSSFVGIGAYAPYSMTSGYLASGAVGATTLRAYYANAVSTSTLIIAHGLNQAPAIALATQLSHASGAGILGTVQWERGLMDTSSCEFRPVLTSGYSAVSGLPVQVVLILP